MLLDRRQFFVREKVAFLKLVDTYDIFDVETGEPIGQAREEPPGWIKAARIIDINKALLPTVLNVYEADGSLALSVRKGVAVVRKKVTVNDAGGQPIGRFESKVFTIGGGFYVYDNDGRQVAEIKGDWKGWNFRFLDADGVEVGLVTKKWAGLGKELFTSADNYVISLGEGVRGTAAAALLLAAGLAIDVVFKEGR